MDIFDAIRDNNMTEFNRTVSRCDFNIEQRDRYNFTPLIRAASGKRLDMMSILLDMGADVDAYSINRVTALWFLCYKSPSTQVTALMNHMLDMNMTNFDMQDTGNKRFDFLFEL